MKQKMLVISILLLGTMHGFSTEIPGEIISAFKSGNAAQLAKYFNQTIELTLFDKEEIYSRTQAEIILRDFFSDNPPSQFQIIHQGGKETSRYAIGSLVSGTNKYRITFLLKTVNAQVFIHQLRIEHEHAE